MRGAIKPILLIFATLMPLQLAAEEWQRRCPIIPVKVLLQRKNNGVRYPRQNHQPWPRQAHHPKEVLRHGTENTTIEAIEARDW